MNTRLTKATVLMSGGIDSAACAHHLLCQGFSVDGLFINYGQAAAMREEKAVAAIADHLGITIRRTGLMGPRNCGPEELIGRNAFLIFTALFLNGKNSPILGLGLHAGTPYYDCSEAFISSIDRLIGEHTDGGVSVIAPFVDWTKKDVYEYFLSSNMPISATYSCEAGGEPVCGVCASCRDRKALGC